MKRKPTRGGARKGAGRKPSGNARVAFSITLKKADFRDMEEDCRKMEISRSDWIDAKIEAANNAEDPEETRELAES